MGRLDWEPPARVRVGADGADQVDRSYGINTFETVSRSNARSQGTFPVLKSDVRQSLVEELIERGNEDDVDELFSLFYNWKTEGDKPTIDTYEWLASESLDLPKSLLRFSGEYRDSPDHSVRGTYESLYEVTQAFLDRNYGEKKHLYRGVWSKSIAVLLAQAIDKPDADRYYFKTSAVANYSGSKDVARYHSGGIIVHWDALRHYIAMAIDHLYDSPVPEDEFHVVGGTIWVDPSGVIHRSQTTNDEVKLRTTVQNLENPGQMNRNYHIDFAELVQYLNEHDVGVSTRDGADRLEGWVDYVVDEELFSEARCELLEKQIEYLTQEATAWRGAI